MARQMTIEEILKMRFKRSKRKNESIGNFEFEKNCSLAPYLKKDERCIVRINLTDDSFYHVTNQRIIREAGEVQEIVKYEEIQDIEWGDNSISPRERLKIKKDEYDTLLFLKKDRTTCKAENLGDSWQLLYRALIMYINLRR